jgi:anaerobic selenocysteine-containing dehydrogenase
VGFERIQMASNLTRRDFLKMGAVAAATSVVSGCTVNLQRTEYLESYVRAPEEGLPGESLWYASSCRQCSAGCGTIVRVSGGRACKIEGNPLHPLNQGKLCARGQAALQELYDPDRLRNAVRQPSRSSQRFQPVRWDYVLGQLTDRLRTTDPARVAILGGNLSTHVWVVTNRFMEGLGGRAPIVYTLGDELEGRQQLSRASEQLFGLPGIPVFAVSDADVVFSFGANILETWLSPVYYSRSYARMRRGELGKRGYLVQFEPRLSSTAASADEWVPVRPGMEGLVALALGRIMTEQGLASQAGEVFNGVSVADVSVASGVPVEDLERLARIFGSVDRPVAIPGGGLIGHRGGLSALAAVQALNQAAEQIGRTGGVFLPPESGIDEFAPVPASSFADIQTLIDDMEAGDVEILLVQAANPVFELPASAGFQEALEGVDLVVSFNSVVDETGVQADLILPDHTSLEGWGYHVPALADRVVVSGQQPVMRPLYDTRTTVDVLLALAQELGGELANALPWQNEVDFLREATVALQDGGSSDSFWAEYRRRGGWWSDATDLRSPTMEGSLTSLLSEPQADQTEAGGYPFHLHLYPSITLFDGRGANKPWLQEAPDPMTTVAWQTWIEINPHTAEELGLADGDVVRVVSYAGGVEALVYVYPGIGENVVAMPVGQGHEHYGRYAQSRGGNPIDLLPAEVDEDTGTLAWAATRVRLEPTGERRELARLESPEGIEHLQDGAH